VLAGRYRVDALLGSGGMGRVFRARDLSAERDVAIKVLLTALNERQRARFQREGELTASLRHPGIVKVHGGGATAGHAFLILELVEGARDLATALAEAPERELDLLIAVAQAVGYAHRMGVVHRDLKPDNILVDRGGRPRVCDFGLAWAAGAEDLTRTGQLLGTPLFMAPECFSASASASGAPRHRPTLDVWSLGVMLYHALTGSYPFGGEGTLIELMARVAKGRVTPPRQLSRSVSPELQAVCLAALAQDPEARYPDADAFAHALLSARHTYGPRRRAVWPPAIGLVALAVAGIGALAFARSVPQLAPSPTAGEAATIPSDTPTPGPTRSELDRVLGEVLVEAHAMTGLRAEVLKTFDLALALAEADPERTARVRVERLAYRFRRGRWEEVARMAGALEELPGRLGDEALMLHLLSEYELQRRDAYEHLRERVRARSASRPRTAIHEALGAWERFIGRDLDAALERARAALELDPDCVPAILVCVGVSGMRRRWDETEPLLRRVASLEPDHPTYHRYFTLLQDRLERREEAVAASRQLVALLEPRPPAIVLRDHAVQCLNASQPGEALATLERVLKRDSADVEAGFSYGMALLRVGREAEAWPRFRDLRDRYPEEFAACLSELQPQAVRERLRLAIGGE